MDRNKNQAWAGICTIRTAPDLHCKPTQADSDCHQERFPSTTAAVGAGASNSTHSVSYVEIYFQFIFLFLLRLILKIILKINSFFALHQKRSDVFYL